MQDCGGLVSGAWEGERRAFSLHDQRGVIHQCRTGGLVSGAWEGRSRLGKDVIMSARHCSLHYLLQYGHMGATYTREHRRDGVYSGEWEGKGNGGERERGQKGGSEVKGDEGGRGYRDRKRKEG